MRIHRNQVELFEQLARVRFVAIACEQLEVVHAERWAAAERGVRAAFVEQGIASARALGLVRETEVLRFLGLLSQLGPARSSTPLTVSLIKNDPFWDRPAVAFAVVAGQEVAP